MKLAALRGQYLKRPAVLAASCCPSIGVCTPHGALQVGCPMRCSFCATGKGGFFRNLMPHEIMDQVMTVQEEFGQRVSNIVFMGMVSGLSK